jgi:hypothetical protein
MAAPKVSHQEILQRLSHVIAKEKEILVNSYDHGVPVSMVAWLARNILELLVWVRYCSKSPELAQQFLTDALRDTIEALDVGTKLAQNPSQFVAAKEGLITTATDDGYENLDHSFTLVSAAAKEVGAGDLFKTYNKLLSKFAHPTAMLVFSNSGETQEHMKKRFYEMAMFFALHGQRIIDETIAELAS